MRQQEDFRTPGGTADAATGGLGAPIFDERSAQKAAPVVPLERVARRERFARLTGNWRATVRTPQFRRSWPLALLILATLVAAAAATNIYTHDDEARNVAGAPATSPAETAAGASANDDARRANASAVPNEIGSSRDARRGRESRESNVSPDAARLVTPETFGASALGGVLGGDVDAGGEQGGDDAAAGRDGRGGERDGGKRHKRSKRRHNAGRGGGGAVLFDVIR